ncbi:MAG: hypothetical protein R3C49_17510 [Planctomycetaceae bacterium]
MARSFPGFAGSSGGRNGFKIRKSPGKAGDIAPRSAKTQQFVVFSSERTLTCSERPLICPEQSKKSLAIDAVVAVAASFQTKQPQGA